MKISDEQYLMAHALLMRLDADGAHKSGRLYPAYTTAELKESVKKYPAGDPTRAKMQGEIDRRESGESKPFSTPQAKWGRDDANQTTHKGYVIKSNVAGDEFYVSKGGAHIATYKSVEAAKRGIDELVD